MKTTTKISASILTSFLLTFAFHAFGQTPDLNGHWKLSGKTNLSGAEYVNNIFYLANIRQAGNSITLERTTEAPNQGKQVTSQTLTMDGKPNMETITPDNKRTSTLTWSAGKTGFTEISIFTDPSNNNQIKYQITEVWTITADGKSLTVLKNFVNPNQADDKWAVKGEYSKE